MVLVPCAIDAIMLDDVHNTVLAAPLPQLVAVVSQARLPLASERPRFHHRSVRASRGTERGSEIGRCRIVYKTLVSAYYLLRRIQHLEFVYRKKLSRSFEQIDNFLVSARLPQHRKTRTIFLE